MNDDRYTEIDVLWLVEHNARELDTACAVSAIAKNEYDIDIVIRNYYQHTKECINTYLPKIVVHPFFYFKEGALATEEYVDTWPDSIHFNLAWEELHYNAHKKIKAPSDAFAKKGVIHHAWGNFYKDYLMKYDVPEGNIFVNGNPAYQLYKEPYREYFCTRLALSERFGLDPSATWVFIPENYRWAFIEKKTKLLTKLGADPDQLKIMQKFSMDSLKTLLQWCKLAKERCPKTEIIFRPRPAVNSSQIFDVFYSISREEPNFSIIKEESVRDWILASDTVVSSYSTTLIEAAIADRPHFMVEPFDTPDELHYDWYKYVERIKNFSEFESVCATLRTNGNNKLKNWAEKEMLDHNDPIRGLAIYIANLLHKQTDTDIELSNNRDSIRFKDNYFNEETHEKDRLTDNMLDECNDKWTKILYSIKSGDRIEHIKIKNEHIINKTMHRNDLLGKDAIEIVNELNILIDTLYENNEYMSSWVGTTPENKIKRNTLQESHAFFDEQPIPKLKWIPDENEIKALQNGLNQRLDYQPIHNASDDVRIPWFLYWEIYWVLKCTKEVMKPGMRILDAGGTSSLFSCYLASKGYEIHSIDLNRRLKDNGDSIAQKMNWNMHSYTMNIMDLTFPDNFFDHAFSICVFEHLDYDIKVAALSEISRCIKNGGIFGITFDYRNPAPGVFGYGKDTRKRNQLKNLRDIDRSFLSNQNFKLIGNKEFVDNKQSYLVHKNFDNTPYTFGAVFLKNEKTVKTISEAFLKLSETVLSIIICTYNRSELLDKCLNSILSNGYDPSQYEIIIVDNNSSDNTKKIAEAYLKKVENLSYIVEKKQGLSHARNAGCMKAKGHYLAYIDDDAKVSEKYIRNVIDVLRKKHPDIMGGPIYPYYNTKKPSWFRDSYEIRKFTDQSKFSWTCRVSGGNFIIKRKLVEKLGMFDPSLGMIGNQVRIGEERALLEKYRNETDKSHQKVYYSLECSVYHYVPDYKMTLHYMLTRSYNVGKGSARVKQKEPPLAVNMIIRFPWDLFLDFRREIGQKGIVKADYHKILFDLVIRLGNIAQLMSHGFRAVVIPHITRKYSWLMMTKKKKK